ncbi:MAG: DUF3168 domain-containing protein [Caulobacterales bacterium]|nr:DUF3168 domain-containing protein [Caulobacterales bacterium]
MIVEALKNCLYQSMAQDNNIMANLGNPLRLYDAPVKQAAFPFAIWRRIEQKPIAQDNSDAFEISITIEIVCKNTGQEEAKKAVDAIKNWAQVTRPNIENLNIALLMCTYCDVFRAIDGRTFLGVVRLKIIAQ